MATDTSAPGEAAVKVLYNFELLETILIKGATTSCPHDHDDPDDRISEVTARANRLRDLYRFQRVNSTFRDVIARSKRLRILMFKTESDDTEAVVESGEDLQLNMNPLISRLEWLGAPIECSKLTNTDVEDDDINVIFVQLTDHPRYHPYRTEMLVRDFKRASSKSLWRQMLLASEPAGGEAEIEIVIDQGDFHYMSEIFEGDTLGEFVDVIVRTLLSCKREHSGGVSLECSDTENGDGDEFESVEVTSNEA